MKKLFLIDGIQTRLQDGMRSGKPVVAITLRYGPDSPVHYFQIDTPMPSADAAAELVRTADEADACQLVAEVLETESKIIAAVNRVFGASDSMAAIAYAKIGSKKYSINRGPLGKRKISYVKPVLS